MDFIAIAEKLGYLKKNFVTELHFTYYYVFMRVSVSFSIFWWDLMLINKGYCAEFIKKNDKQNDKSYQLNDD
uniref:Uncharacterized protein n=1 Tax=viral metagenome TaxID=1070528 RepID=A0A6C0CD52_9ZZZZ